MGKDDWPRGRNRRSDVASTPQGTRVEEQKNPRQIAGLISDSTLGITQF